VEGVLDVEATCLNRDLPNRLPFGGGQPRLQLSEGAAPVTRIECLTPPTRTLRPVLGRGMLWRFVSHLLLNHLSVGGEGGADALKEIFRLYDFQNSPTTRNLIDGVVGVECRRAVRRIVVEGRSAPCNGVEVEVQLDAETLRKSGLFLFACVLERFLPLYGSINSFTQLVATVKGREGILKQWPPRAADRPLV
jgi:type VI secretion system protein ImpG